MCHLKEQLTPDLNWYVILNQTSDGNPQRWFYMNSGENAQGIWLGTPYAEWREVMPNIAQISPEHPFLDWIATESCDDWGIIVGSEADFATVQAHFRSLTHVWLPSGEHVFFRFYDPRFGLDVATFCEDEARTALMGPTQCWLSLSSSQQELTRVDNPTPTATADFQERAFPWWTVPEAVLAALSEDPSVLTNNLLQGLSEYQQALYDAYPEPVLRQKTERFVARYQGEKDGYLAAFIEYIEQEQQRLGMLS
ncbi:DUF4123 domain-containing protein [Vibrio mangrovi]|uniref:DUF4123 domain-containing protein n=1 Tax=Vibrio mangrovi TaxID=474394 RepID=A0A1Y6J1F4_9VIBR|nr:DUF4123 domain-containing protein [Vibrio mangrovi]MDW6004864.1 DUF4123 domain-containing protein [Vibrio mangrovi]SMS03081.1 hypothetical protein VIM7927_04446 [Vibrio mangrovi]